MSNHFFESRDTSYVSSPWVQNIPGKNAELTPPGNRLHPSESGPKFVQGSGGMATSLTLLGPILVWSQQNWLVDIAVEREVLRVLLGLLAPRLSPKEKWTRKWVNEWVCRPTLNISIYEIVFSVFSKSKCRIQISIIGRKLAFLWKWVKRIRHGRENGVDTLKLHHDILLQIFKKNTGLWTSRRNICVSSKSNIYLQPSNLKLWAGDCSWLPGYGGNYSSDLPL